MIESLLPLLSFYLSFKVTPKKIAAYLQARGQTDRPALEYVAPEAVRAAAVQLPRRRYEDLADYAGEMYRHTRDAAEAGAHLVVFPEYTGLLGATMAPLGKRLLEWVMQGEENAPSPARAAVLAEAFGGFLEELYLCTFSTIARLQKVYIVAGSSLFYEDGELRHRSVVFGPDGEPVGAQEKLCPLGIDRAIGIEPGKSPELIDTALGRLGVVCGTDAYYPEYFAILRKRGVQMIAAPDSHGGALRELLRCRAQQYGMYVIYSCIAGEGEDGARAALLAPAKATPDWDGIVARMHEGSAGAISARLNLSRLEISEAHEPNPAFLAGDHLHSYRYHSG